MRFFFLLLIFWSCSPQQVTSIPFRADLFVIDGLLDEPLWKETYKVFEFENLLDTTSNHRPYPTSLQISYTHTALLFGGHVSYDVLPENMIRTRDSTLYLQHCFEIFFDPYADGIDYYELEINPTGTIWDLKLKNANGRINAPSNMLPWDIPLEQVRTYIHERDNYWSFEIAIPWSYIKEGRPSYNDTWSFNAMRIDYESSQQPSYWVWQRTGKEMIHVPSQWVKLQFN